MGLALLGQQFLGRLRPGAEGAEVAAKAGDDGKSGKPAPKARANVKRAVPKPPKA